MSSLHKFEILTSELAAGVKAEGSLETAQGGILVPREGVENGKVVTDV
jgi:hypothetical protein